MVYHNSYRFLPFLQIARHMDFNTEDEKKRKSLRTPKDLASYLYPWGNNELSLVGVIIIKLSCFSKKYVSLFSPEVQNKGELKALAYLSVTGLAWWSEVLCVIHRENTVYFYLRQNFLQLSFYTHQN